MSKIIRKNLQIFEIIIFLRNHFWHLKFKFLIFDSQHYRRDDYLSYEDSLDRIRLQTSQHPVLEESLNIWFLEMRKLKAVINDAIVVKNAE